MTEKSIIKIAIGALIRVRAGRAELFVTRRADETVLGGLWELPGGKVEAGESARDCLVREFFEEVGLRVRPTTALDTIEHTYDHARVRLHPWLCDFAHEPPRTPRTPQTPAGMTPASHRRWITADQLTDLRFPPANQALMRTLTHTLTNHPTPGHATQGRST